MYTSTLVASNPASHPVSNVSIGDKYALCSYIWLLGGGKKQLSSAR